MYMMHFKARQQFVVFTGKQKYFVKLREEVKFFFEVVIHMVCFKAREQFMASTEKKKYFVEVTV